MRHALAARSGDLRASSASRRRPRLARVELLRRSLDRAPARARPRAAGGAAVHVRRGLRRRPVDVLQVSARRPLRALRRRGHRAERLAAARRSPRGAAGARASADRGSRRVLPSRHRGHELSRRARQDVDRRPGARCASRAGSATSTTPATTSSRAATSPVCSVSSERRSHRICRRTWRSRSSASRAAAPSGRALVAASLDLLRTHLDRRPHDNPFRRYAARFAADLDLLAAEPLGAVSWLRVRHVPAVRRRVRARRRVSPLAPGDTARAASTDRGRLRRHRHHRQGASVQDRAPRQRTPSLRSGADARHDGRAPGTRR